MNKFLCDANKKRGKFKRYFCDNCSYQSRCVDYLEYKYGHDDEIRDAIHQGADE